ncbi:hypothetical protein HK105_208582 [Polyrhizophydium stewartii]|uniref:Carrier domain-containing protein n=1 Tax=Polyrhizophydium stewartii TaxID=2732419 RepID=A0ABR4MXB7_9FUNG
MESERIREIAELLGIASGDSSFTSSGGDSLAAIRLAAKAQELNIPLTAADLMGGKSIMQALEEAFKRDKTTLMRSKVAFNAGMVAATVQDARAYLAQIPLRATRSVSLESLRGALRAVVQHHAILRTSFVSTVAGGIVQVVRASADAAECVAVAAPLAQHLAADKARGFSLADASWIRAALVCDPAGSAQHVVVTIHHALYDGWSLPMIMRDLAAALDGHALEPRPAFRTVVDFIAAQDAAATEAFWTQQLVGLEPAQPLSLGHSARTDDEDAPLAQACSTPMAELQRAAQRAGVTVAVVLKAAWAATLRKFTRSHDVVFGEVLANRDIAVAGADRIVGPLLNTVPCRVVLDDTARAADLVATLQAQHGAVLSHSHAALVDVQRWAGVQGDAKLFNTLNHVEFSALFDHTHLSRTQAASILAEFDFDVQQLVSALSDKATVESLWTLSPAQQAMIARFSHGERVPLPFLLVHHGFEARAKQHPDWRAVEHGDAHLSYGDLDACSSALAAELASHGVQRGSRAAVVMQRSIEFVVALVGVLKAGATIVPVDSSFPADRIQFMLDDASVCAIVTTASEAGRIAQLTVGDRAVVVADARALLVSGVSFVPAAQHMAAGDDDAFIVYTSGSTAQRFVPDPFSPEPGARMFRTGDLGRLLPDGNFEILGRMDDQVKLKGYRIELDEVAAAMMRHPRVSAAAAVVKDKTHLVGFVVPADVDHDELRDVVAAALPAYMVPAVFVGLAVMPTNTNGKTDKKALAAMHVEIAVDALQTDTERALAAVWSQVLGVHVADIGRATSFFALGGDSISAIKAAAAMQRAGISITVPQLFKAQTVSRVAALAESGDAHDGQTSTMQWPAAVLSDETLAELAGIGDFVDAYPATPLQAGMVAATVQDARAYLAQIPLRATRSVSLESLRGALRAVVQHHAILRTSFVSTVAGGIVQIVRASADAAECVAVAAPLAQHLAADKARGFSLADASWIRAALVCDPAGSAQHVVVTIHHALYDGWSLPMIMRDLAAALDGHALEPRPAFRTVVDFIAAQDAAATEAFWTQQLVGLEPAQPLSLGHSARTDDEDAPLAQAWRAAQRAGVTVAVVLKAAWAATLRKFTRSHDVVFGEVLANRDIAVGGADRIVGPLLNTVPCRVVLDDTARAADLVASMQAQHGAVLSHSHAALVDVQRWAGVQGDGKLFNTLFVFENLPSNDTEYSDGYGPALSGDIDGSQFSQSLEYSFELILYPGTEIAILQAQFDHAHLSRSQAASILAEFDFGVQQLVSALSDKATVESLWTLSPAQQAMIARFSHGERVPLPFVLVHHGFEARAKQHPDWRAVEHGDAHLSYGDLDACGCALAAALASHGVQRGSRVAVVMQRSIEFVVALVGVLKAGATIVPVDSSFPADRIQFMLDDASVCAIVTTASEAGRIAQLSVGDRAVVVADARALLASGVSFTPAAQHTATGDDDAFIVYTSGSTGKPKGVAARHIVTVGKPFRTHLVTSSTRQYRLVPIGVVGEMCIGGIGVSRGYINLPDLTAQRFVPDPFSPEPGARMFRTGDLGRLLPDGNFEILGRMDDQVKLKGYRIELDEVAAAMMRHPRVSAAAAVVKDKTHLVGFVVPADVDHDELRDVVAAALPAYMVPAVFVGLAVMPTNTNGKTDKKALAAMHVEIAVDALQTDTERALAAVWSQVLGVQVADIGRATSFFALGGDSISAIRLVAKAKQQGLTLSSALIFKAPTLTKMALAATVSETRAAVSSAPVTGSVALTPIQHMFFAHDWINISHFNQSFVVTPRDTLDIGTLTAAIARLAEHHDMLRARFAQGDDGAWSQTLLPPSPQTDAANVLAVAVESDDDALACIREAQESLSITHGPLLAVRLLHMHDGSQRLFFGIHHLVVDLVSWRVLLDDLETLLRGRQLAPKTLSFQAWAARMAAHAATIDAAPWRDLIGDHTTLLATQPPATGVPVRAYQARAVLDEATTAQLDVANEPFNTNIQELVLAALVLSLADVAGCASSPAQLCIELEGHGREPFAADLDVSSTVGWFTSVFPVAFSASTASDIGAVVRQVKHKIRSVPLKGLSYGMIKHLAPPTADNAFVKAHGGHAVAFNYLGRFQSLEADDAFFVVDIAMSKYQSVRNDDRLFHAIELNCAHDGPRLVLSATVEDWIVSEPTMQAWLDRWQVWMQRVVAHCVDPATHGGRTVSDVPLMASQAAVEQAEAELAAVLSLRARDIVDMYPVTPLQAGFLSAMIRDPSEYTLQSAFDVTGNMDVQRLRAAWHAVAMAHPIVRTVFVSTASGLVQAVAKDDHTEWTELDGVWSADDDALQAATDALMAADRARGFSMASASFHRFTIVQLAGSGIDAKRVQFRDHVEWLLDQDAATSEQFWRESLAHATDAGKLAPPKPRQSELTGAKYGELHASVDLPHLETVCKAHGVTTSTVLRLAWALVLRHFTRSEHVLFGSVVSGRDGGIDGIDEIVGVLINTIAVPSHLRLDLSIASALAAMQSFSANAIAHSHVGLVNVQSAAGVASDSKLFDTIMVFENYPLRDAGVALDFALKPIKSNEFVDAAVTAVFDQTDIEMHIQMQFDRSIVPAWFAQTMAEKLADVLTRLCSEDNLQKTTVADIDVLSKSQQAQITRFSHGERVPLPFSLVHHGFEARAKQHPDWRAVEHGDAHLSYGDLDACSSALAAALALHGVQRGSRVAIVMQRSIEFVVALVGVLKAGATIVPVDSSFPADRIQFMLDDASVCAIVTTASEAARVAQLSVGDRAVVVADARALLASGVSFTPAAQHTATGDDDAFIVYTSGSTGKPKGVPVPHKGVVNVVTERSRRFDIQPGDRQGQFMAISFDACQSETWLALSNACTLVLREDDALRTASKIKTLFITPTGLAHLGSPNNFDNIKNVSVGGEICPKELKDLWAGKAQFDNAYGPTEISIISHAARLTQSDDVSIGRPIINASSYVVDSRGGFVPVGVVGEMHIGGIGVSRGYINLPDLTAQRFVHDPFSPEPGARMFRTGDLGRLLPDGNFEILGRMDDQVKLKGYRIELDEVAAAMMRHPRVSAAAAVVKDKTHLVGFVVPADVDHDELRDVVAAALPAYMVPAVFVGLAVMPTNTNGKTDKKALAAMHVEIAVDALQTDTERALAAVWSQVLGVHVADIGRATSFFALGGDSISAIKAAAAMQRAGISITVPQLFKAQTVARVAALADAPDAHGGHSLRQSGRLHDETLAELAAVGDFVDAYPATPLQAGMVPLRATRTVSLESLRGALRAVVQHHAILRTSFVSTVAGGIVQVVRASADAAECVAVAAPLAQHLAADKARGFSLTDASWIRAALVCDPAGSAQHVVVTIHHALYDGWSLPMIMRDLAAALDGHALEPRPAFRTVVDFIAAQDAAATEAFWTQQLVGLEPAQPLSLGHSARTDDEDAPLAQACSTPMAELQRAAQRAGVTVAVVLKAAWAATLRKFTRSHDVVFGEVLANRDIAVGGADRIVGPLLNTVPCRVVLDDTVRAADLVASLQAQHGAVLSHSHAALVDVQRWAGVQGDGKLFNTLFVYENLPSNDKDHSDGSGPALSGDIDGIQSSQSLAYSFELILNPLSNNVDFRALFDHAHLSRSQAASILAEFDFGVQQLVSALSDKATVESLWTLSPAQQALIARFSHGERVPLPFSLVHHGFEARAKQHPDWRAVEHGDAHLSYGDLDACGSALAAALASHGVQRGSRVAVVMQRSIEFVVALVGVLKAGATIVPVDSSFPADRIQFMLDDASVCAIVTTASEADRIAQLSVGDRAVVVADARALLASGVSFTPAAQHTATGDDDAFIVYTSGSTGKPKGVPVPHIGAANVVSLQSERIGCVEHARVAQFMAIGFDVCQWEVWGALSFGCTLVLREEDAFETFAKVNVLHITPTGLAQIGAPQAIPQVTHIAVGGEACPKELKDICYVLDSRLRQVPIGVVGEYFTSTPGINASRGYLNLPDLTAQRFVPDPFSPEPGARMFRTGDLGRLLPDGNFEILGRMDDQVKLKGYRIELDEVAAAMMRHPRVSAAAAVVKDKTHLVGFVVPADVDHDELRDVVAAALPAYMVPAVFVGLAVMPTNTNGKTDKKALAAMHVEIAVDALQTDTERALAAVWSQVLGVQVADIGRATSFFALGGDSISAIKAAAAMQRAGISITVPQLFKAQTVARVAALADAADAHDGHSNATEWPAAVLSDETLAELASVGDFVDAYPATPLQAGMVAATMQDARAYVNQVPLRATRSVSLESLRGALRAVVQHHAILRTSFVSTVAGGIVQVVRASADAAECVAVAAPLAQHLAADKARGFSLTDASWIRAALVCDPAGSAQHVVVTIHHALYDGWSLPMIMRDLAAALDGHALEPRPAFRTVVDFIAAQDAAATEAFWTQQLVGLEPAQPLSLGHSARTDDEDAPLAQACSTPMAELQRAAQRAGVTVAVVLKAAWAATLRKFTRSHDVVFGQLVSGRDIPVRGVDRVIGPVMNSIPCIVRAQGTVTIAAVLSSLLDQHLAMLPMSQTGFDDQRRFAGLQPSERIFTTAVIIQNFGDQTSTDQQADFDLVPSLSISTHTMAHSIELYLVTSAAKLQISAMFNHGHLSRSQVRLVLDEFDFTLSLLARMDATETLIDALWAFSPALQAQIAQFSRGPAVPVEFSCIHHAFEAQAAATPDSIALDDGFATLTYAALDARANQLAHTLQRLGAAPEVSVAVIASRSIEFVVGILGVLKAGAAFVPIEASTPQERIRFMLESCGVPIVATTAEASHAVLASFVGKIVRIDNLPADTPTHKPVDAATARSLAYTIFTSGTTGTPKGVLIEHGGIHTRAKHHPIVTHLGPGVRMLQTFTVGFDACIEEIFHGLCAGATMVLWGRRTILEAMANVDVMQISPSALLQIDPADLPRLKAVCAGVEACPQSLVDRWAGRVAFYSDYGPTEATMVATCTARLAPGDRITLGRPLANTAIHIVDDAGRRVPPGVKGRVFIGGVGIARGYLGQPDLTAEKFVADIDDDSKTMYDTGDIGRWTHDDQVEYLGRSNDQVKIKGYRIELEEVAKVLGNCAGVKSAVAMARDGRLVAFVTPARVDVDAVLAQAGERLPGYMMPSAIVVLDAMPMSINGKVDKKALAAMHVEIAVDAPQTDTERALAAVWSQVLGVQVADIGRTTSFFALGGDSISAIKAAAAMQRAGISITVPQLFKAQTVARVAALAESGDAHDGQTSTMQWPAAVLRCVVCGIVVSLRHMLTLVCVVNACACSDETLAELAGIGDFVDAYPATPLQAGMVAATVQDARAYLAQIPLRATRSVSLESLRGALRAVVQHHAILRTSFVSTVAGGIVQVVRASADAAECVAVAAPLAQHLAADKARGFSLADASWIRAALVCDPAGSAQHVVVTIHHALYDGWSLPMIMRDLAAALDGHALEPRPAFRTVVDFIAAQDAAATEAFWTQQLVGLEPAQPLSLGHSARTDDEDAPLAQACSTPMAELQRAAQRAGVTVAVVLKAAWAATLRKFTRSHDVVFGEVLANRDIAVAGADRIVGPLLNTVPCRVVLDDTARAADLVASLQAQHGAVLSHSHAALVDVQRWAGVQGDGKLFNTLFVFENMPDGDGSQHQTEALLSFEASSVDTRRSRSHEYSVELVVYPSPEIISVSMQFDHSHLSRSQAASILAEFDFGVQQLVSALSDKATVESLWTLSPAQQALIARFSHGERVPLPFSLVHHGFEARAKQHPDWRAVEHGDAHLSYGDLDACGCALAAALASHGVQRGSRVAVVMQRSIEFVVALVGVLKAGATIVPVDSSFPADRIQFMLDDASVCAIVTTASEAGRIAQLSVGDRAVVVADARALLASGVSFTPAAQHTATGDDDAFIVYTSGSTGKPKGVPVPHKGVINVVSLQSANIGCVEHARVGQFMAIGFDACQWETWSALSHGSTLVLREADAFDMAASIDVLVITPTGLQQLGKPSDLPKLKSVTVAGEACSNELKDLWAPHVRFNNAYGPTEISIISHLPRLKFHDSVHLGKPIANTSCHILDMKCRQVPVGVVGEMCLGGIGVSRGYINLPDLTAQRFVPDPFSPEPGARMFRTGDLGRLLPDGNFEILGRMDDQVKLKGYRIELDEVAAAMMRHPRVSAAAAVVKDKTHLVGFVVPADVDHDELRDVVAAALPAYMVPAVFVGLAVMPTNTNGKTDKKALAAMHVEIAVDALQTDTERALAAVWSQVLGVHVADIGRATSFFALGGDSISAIKAAAAMQRAGISITVPQLFNAQTVSRVAALTESGDAHDGQTSTMQWPAAVLSDETLAELAGIGDFVDAYPATPLQAGMVAATMQDARAYLTQIPLRATRTVSLESLRGALRAVVQHHAIMRTSFVSTVAGGIVQVVRASADAAECVAVAAPLAQHLAADKARGFSLTDASWIRAALVCDPAGSAQHVVVTIHHALYDGWSLPMIMRDLAAALDGHALEPRPAFRTVVDFIAAQDAAATEAFWMQQLVGLEPAQPLSLGHSARTDEEDAPLAQACSTPMAELQRAAQRAGVTVAVFTRSHDVVFGEVLANRDIAVGGADRIVGPLLNTVPCRVVLDDTVRAADLVASLQAQHGAVLSHSHAALVDVQRWAGVQGDGKLFNTLFVFENLPSNDKDYSDGSGPALSGDIDGSQFSQSLEYSFELTLYPGTEIAILQAQFDHAHLSRSQAASILAEFDFGVQQLVSALADKATVESLWTLSPAQQSMIARFSRGPAVPVEFSCIHHAFDAQAAATPDAIALDDGFVTLTYAALDARANQLAHTLQRLGAAPEVSVAVIASRSIEFVVGILGVLKAGAAFVPIDALTPQERIRFMLESCGVPIVATTAEASHAVLASFVGKIVRIDNLPADTPTHKPVDAATARSLAYTIFTSGTTGTPKGVLIEHGGIHTRAKHHPIVTHLGPGVRMLQTFTVGFDACIEEIFHGLCTGATMVLWGRRTILEAMATVDVMQISPSAMLQIEPAELPRLKAVCAGVEACPQSLVDQWAGRVAFYSDYGPTEATMVATCTARLAPGDRITLGRPLANTAIHIVDDAGRRVPPGVKGRVFIGGVGIARGYLGQPDLTAEKFVADIDDDSKTMYDTGDIGRWTHDDQVEYLGRSNDQVKIKGYRIELEEVAKVLGSCAGVKSAVAMARDGMLVAFVTPSGVDVEVVLAQAGERLPVYMVPSAVVVLDAMPMSINGKVDKKALAAMHVKIAVNAPQTDTERALAAVWSQVLGVQIADIGLATSFFALGGDSISAIRLLKAIQQRFEVLTMSHAVILKQPQLARMAASINALQYQESTESIGFFKGLKNSLPVPSSQPTIRIACFHGQGSNTIHMEHQLSAIKAALGETADFVFIQAPHATKSSYLSEFYKGMDWFEWLPPSSQTQSDVDELIAYATQQLEKIGHVDVLLGFSQGAMVVELLDRLVQAGSIKQTWRLSVLCSGVAFSSWQLPKSLAASKLHDVPSIHIFGTNEHKAFQMQLPTRYAAAKRTVIKHAAGHDIPRDAEFGHKVEEAIAVRIDSQTVTRSVALKNRTQMAKARSLLASMLLCFR